MTVSTKPRQKLIRRCNSRYPFLIFRYIFFCTPYVDAPLLPSMFWLKNATMPAARIEECNHAAYAASPQDSCILCSPIGLGTGNANLFKSASIFNRVEAHTFRLRKAPLFPLPETKDKEKGQCDGNSQADYNARAGARARARAGARAGAEPRTRARARAEPRTRDSARASARA